jgi:magnesium-transporting ATPase (P-type)
VVRRASRAGIRTLVLTGDQRATAAVAQQVGIRGDAVDAGDLGARLEGGDPEAIALLETAVAFRVRPKG